MKNYKFKVKRNRNKNILGMRVMFKKCSKCGEIKFRDKFYSDKRVPSGLTDSCKECRNKCRNSSKYTHTCEQCGKEFKSKAKKQRFCGFECQGKWQSENRTGENSANWQGGKIIVSCSYCGKEIEVNKNRIKRSKNLFCSTECHGLWKSENLVGKSNHNYKKESHIKCNCDYCNKEFETTKTKYNKSKNHFCSRECQGKWNNKKVKCNCSYCGKEFEVGQYNNSKHHYCSKECYNKLREEKGKIKCNCAYCNKELNVKKSQYNNNGNNFCDNECYAKFNRGENHPRYNPDLTDEERDKERKIIKGYTEAVKETYERDNYTCQCCGKRGNGNLNAHHIYGYAEHKDLRTDIDNLVSLCEECHKRYHKQYGYTNNNYKDFRTFLYNEMIKQGSLEARLFYINTIEDITLRLEIRGLLELESA